MVEKMTCEKKKKSLESISNILNLSTRNFVRTLSNPKIIDLDLKKVPFSWKYCCLLSVDFVGDL